MRTCLFASLLLFAAILVLTACGDSSPTSSLGVSGPDLIDPRDGQTYKTVTIGSQTWMAENLNYETAEGSFCYDNNSTNCTTYGRLYTWDAAVAETTCPDGWHLPTSLEWDALIQSVGTSNPAMKLKAKEGWVNDGNGDDTYGFSALPGGYIFYNPAIDKRFHQYVQERASFWTASEKDSERAFYRYMEYNEENVFQATGAKGIANSVRCVQNDPQ
jgi:uncharacterized protein (TIGR02145 family)